MAARTIGQAKFDEMFGGVPELDKGRSEREFLLCRITQALAKLINCQNKEDGR